MPRRARSIVVPLSFVVLGAIGVGGAGCLDASSNVGQPDGGLPALDGGAGRLPDFDASGTVTGAGSDAGGPSARLSATHIDFGPVDCGGAPPTDQALVLANAGGGSLTWTAALGGTSAFTLAGASSGALPPGAAANVTVRAAPIDATATAGATSQATLVLTTNDPAHASISLPVTITPSGGALSVSPALVDFGTLPLAKKEIAVAVDLTNTGNAPVTLGLTQPSDPQFVLEWTGAPAAITIPAGGSLPGLTAHFKPTSTLPSSAAATLTPTTAICGASATSIAVKGQGTNGSAGIQPGSLDFGAVSCGRSGTAKSVSLSNSGSAPFTFTAALGASSPYALSATTGTVAAGATTTITVTPKAVPATSLTTPDLYADTLTLTTDVQGDTPHLVPLHETAKGARLAFNPSTIAFKDVPVSKGAANPFAVTNGGNAPASVTLAVTGTPFGVTPTAATTANAAGSLSATASFQPVAVGAASGTIAVTTSDVLCAPLPAPMTLTGNGTLGKVALSTTSIDFLGIDCGKAAAAQTFQVQNTGSATLGWTAALASGAWYTLSPATGSLGAGLTATITVTPKAVPGTSALTPDLYADTVHVTTDVPGDTAAHDVALHETARGAILSFSPGAIAFNGTPVNTTSSSGFSVVNNGNAPASVALASSGPAFSLSATSANAIAANGGNAAFNASFKPTDTTAQTGVVALSATGGTVLCQPLPAPLTLSGTGTLGVASVGPSSLSFGNAGLVDCSTRASAQSASITNTGNGAITWTAALGGASYTLGKSSGSLAGGGASDTIVITPVAIPAASATSTDLYADTLTVTWTTQSGVTTKDTVALHMTAHGAILGWQTAQGAPFTGAAFGNVPVSQSPSQPFTLRNSGNAAASVSFTSSDPAFAINPQNQPVTTTLPGTIVFSPTKNVAYASTAAMVPASGTPLCGPVPAPVSLTGTGTNGVPSIPVTPLDFGPVSCGSAPGTRTVTVKNSGNAPFTITASLGASALPFTIVSPASGATVPALGSVDVVVAAPAINAPADVTPGHYDGQLLIATAGAANDAPNPHAIPLKLSAQGAILSWVDAQGASLGSVDFGSVGIRTPASAPFTLRNSGNLAPNVTLSLAGSTDFGATAGGVVPVNGALPGSFTFTPTATGALAAQATLAITNSVASCGALPGPVSLAGTGANGAPTVSPAALSFGTNGLVRCGTGAPATQNVVISNGGNAPFDWSATLLKSALAYVVSPSSGTVQPGASTTIVVSAPAINAPASIAAGAYDGTLRITTTAAADTAHDVALHATAEGAILSATLKSPFPTAAGNVIDYGSQSGQFSANGVVVLANTGNLAGTVTLVNRQVSTFFFKPNSTAVQPGASVGIAGAFSPAPQGPTSDTLTFDTGTTAICDSTLPKSVTLQGANAFGGLTVTAAPPDFGEVCNGTLSATGAPSRVNPAANPTIQQSFTLQNNGTAPLTWAVKNLLSTGGLFQIINQPQQTLKVGDAVKVTVQPLDVPKPNGAYSDSFDVTSSSGPGVTVPLSAKADGVAWVFSPNPFVMPAGVAAGTVQITNNGNVDSEIFLLEPGSGVWRYSTSDIKSLPPGQSLGINVTLLRQNSKPPYAETVTTSINVKLNPPVCAAPPVLQLSGN